MVAIIDSSASKLGIGIRLIRKLGFKKEDFIGR